MKITDTCLINTQKEESFMLGLIGVLLIKWVSCLTIFEIVCVYLYLTTSGAAVTMKLLARSAFAEHLRTV